MSGHHDADGPAVKLSARVLRPGTGSLAARIRLGYDSADPYAVAMTVRLPGGRVIPWTFGRSLLADGLRRETGIGDVTVAPCPQAPSDLLHVTLRNDVSDAVLEMRMSPVSEFLLLTYRRVPLGREGLFLVVDDDVSAIAS